MKRRTLLTLLPLGALVGCDQSPGGQPSPTNSAASYPSPARTLTPSGEHTVATLTVTGQGMTPDELRRVVEARVQRLGQQRFQVVATGPDALEVTFDQVVPDERVQTLAGPLKATFQPVQGSAPDPTCAQLNATGLPGASTDQACDVTRGIRYQLAAPVLTGSDIKDATLRDGEGGAGKVVSLQLTDQAAQTLAKVTGELSGMAPPQNQLAIVVDGQAVSAPTVMAPITGGQLEISGAGMETIHALLLGAKAGASVRVESVHKVG